MSSSKQPAGGQSHTTDAEDRAVGLVLRAGAFVSILLIVAGGMISAFMPGGPGRQVSEAGVIALMATPITRVLTATIVFWHEGDRRYALISAGVFLILIGSSVLAALKVLPALER